MPLNPQTEAFFGALAQNDSPQTHEQTPADAREGYRTLAAALGEERPRGVEAIRGQDDQNSDQGEAAVPVCEQSSKGHG